MAEEPTNTPAANQPDSDPAPANTPSPAPTGEQPGNTPAGDAAPPAGKDEPLIPLGDEKPDAKPDGDGQPDGGKPDDKAKPTGAPDSYADFTLPDGFKWDDARKNEATTLFKEIGLPQESAQKLVTAYCKAVKDQADADAAELMSIRKQWRESVQARPDYREQMALMKKGARLLITTDEQRKLLNSWLQDSPAIFDMFVTAGRLVAEDNMISGTPPSKPTETQINQERFPNL